MARILLTNPPEMLKNFYGDRALAGWRDAPRAAASILTPL
jgi:hypothetical protein